MNIINETRLGVWRKQPESFNEEALIDGDGTLAPSTGECKEGMDFSYNGTWGYHPLVISLANTQEPLFMVNRSGNRPSHEGAAAYFDQAIELCRKGGFQRITLRGDTDFSQTGFLDGSPSTCCGTVCRALDCVRADDPILNAEAELAQAEADRREGPTIRLRSDHRLFLARPRPTAPRDSVWSEMRATSARRSAILTECVGFPVIGIRRGATRSSRGPRGASARGPR